MERKSQTVKSCCAPKKDEPSCHSSRRFDWLLWGAGSLVILGMMLHLLPLPTLPAWLTTYAHGTWNLMATMWWGLALGVLFVGILSHVPRAFVLSVIGKPGTKLGLLRATAAGLMLDLCSHGILLVGMKLYERGASFGQVAAFLIASPWNSLSLTLILIALIGLKWTLLFILLSAVIALAAGSLFDLLVKRGSLPTNPNPTDLPEDFAFWQEAKNSLKRTEWSPRFLFTLFTNGLKEARMILRWIFVGVVLASLIQAFVSTEQFQTLFGPTLAGLGLTLLAATIIEVCSEGSTPIAADILTRGGAPGNSFAFLMTGVATDYTEIMAIKETTRSWKMALFLPLITVPQVMLIGWLLNQFPS